MSRCLAVLAIALLSIPARAQVHTDTVFTWRAYAREGSTHLTIYRNASDADRPHTAIVREIAANRGPASIADARHLVELVGRQYTLDPTEVTWLFHWGSFSFEHAAESRRELFLRATFRRLPSGNLSTPSWRVMSRPEVEALTGRHFR